MARTERQIQLRLTVMVVLVAVGIYLLFTMLTTTVFWDSLVKQRPVAMTIEEIRFEFAASAERRTQIRINQERVASKLQALDECQRQFDGAANDLERIRALTLIASVHTDYSSMVAHGNSIVAVIALRPSYANYRLFQFFLSEIDFVDSASLRAMTVGKLAALPIARSSTFTSINQQASISDANSNVRESESFRTYVEGATSLSLEGRTVSETDQSIFVGSKTVSRELTRRIANLRSVDAEYEKALTEITRDEAALVAKMSATDSVFYLQVGQRVALSSLIASIIAVLIAAIAKDLTTLNRIARATSLWVVFEGRRDSPELNKAIVSLLVDQKSQRNIFALQREYTDNLTAASRYAAGFEPQQKTTPSSSVEHVPNGEAVFVGKPR